MARGELDKYEKALSDSERQSLHEVYRSQLGVQKQIIKDNILKDREHLRLVNFSTGPFLYRGILGVETGYLFVRVEPLYELGIKHFDIAIYNRQSKVMLLVECKSSIVEVSTEVDHVVEASKESLANISGLKDIVGDSLGTVEMVICTNAAYGSRVREHLKGKNLRLCLWIADQATNKLLLEPQSENTESEILGGRLHGDGKLTRLLIGGVDSIGVRSVPFLPSSHPSTLTEEVIPLLDLKLRDAGLDKFRLSDLHFVLKGNLLNISDDELLKLSELIVRNGVQSEIFRDSKPWEGSAKDKEYEIAVRTSSVRAMTDDIREKYINFHSIGKAEVASIKKFEELGLKKTKSLQGFLDPK